MLICWNVMVLLSDKLWTSCRSILNRNRSDLIRGHVFGFGRARALDSLFRAARVRRVPRWPSPVDLAAFAQIVKSCRSNRRPPYMNTVSSSSSTAWAELSLHKSSFFFPSIRTGTRKTVLVVWFVLVLSNSAFIHFRSYVFFVATCLFAVQCARTIRSKKIGSWHKSTPRHRSTRCESTGPTLSLPVRSCKHLFHLTFAFYFHLNRF